MMSSVVIPAFWQWRVRVQQLKLVLHISGTIFCISLCILYIFRSLAPSHHLYIVQMSKGSQPVSRYNGFLTAIMVRPITMLIIELFFLAFVNSEQTTTAYLNCGLT